MPTMLLSTPEEPTTLFLPSSSDIQLDELLHQETLKQPPSQQFFLSEPSTEQTGPPQRLQRPSVGRTGFSQTRALTEQGEVSYVFGRRPSTGSSVPPIARAGVRNNSHPNAPQPISNWPPARTSASPMTSPTEEGSRSPSASPIQRLGQPRQTALPSPTLSRGSPQKKLSDSWETPNPESERAWPPKKTESSPEPLRRHAEPPSSPEFTERAWPPKKLEASGTAWPPKRISRSRTPLESKPIVDNPSNTEL